MGLRQERLTSRYLFDGTADAFLQAGSLVHLPDVNQLLANTTNVSATN